MSGQPNDWVDAYDGTNAPQQYGVGADGTPTATPLQGMPGSNPLAGLQQALSGYLSGGGSSGFGMPQVDTYGQQSLDVPGNSAFIDPASTDIAF